MYHWEASDKTGKLTQITSLSLKFVFFCFLTLLIRFSYQTKSAGNNIKIYNIHVEGKTFSSILIIYNLNVSNVCMYTMKIPWQTFLSTWNVPFIYKHLDHISLPAWLYIQKQQKSQSIAFYVRWVFCTRIVRKKLSVDSKSVCVYIFAFNLQWLKEALEFRNIPLHFVPFNYHNTSTGVKNIT